MADISITAASVAKSSQGEWLSAYAFGYASATAGQSVYLDSSSTWQKMDSNAAVTGNTVAAVKGITLNGGGIGQPADVCIRDLGGFTLGGTLTNGSAVYSSVTAGGVTHDVPTTGAYPTSFGIANSTTTFIFNPVSSGVVI